MRSNSYTFRQIFLRMGRVRSDMGGKIWTKFGGWYHTTKYAVEGLSDCLRMELKPFGIDVIVVEPGGIKTDWGIIAAENLKRLRQTVRMRRWRIKPQTV